MKQKQWRQGDLLIIKVSDNTLSDIKNKEKRKDRILAYGEVTGHHHRLTDGTVFETPGSIRFFRSNVPTTLIHEEHAPVKFEPGTYEVRRQREFEPKSITKERRVVD